MNARASSLGASSSEKLPRVYKEAFKQLYNTRRWGPRLLDETCRRFNISPRKMLRTYGVLLVVRLARSKPFRRRTFRKGEVLGDDTLKSVRETLLSASFSRYSDRQHTDSLLNGTQIQLKLREKARFVDPEKEGDTFHRAVCSLPHAQDVSEDVRIEIANKLRAFYESGRFQSDGKKTKLQPVSQLTEHLTRYRLYTNYWRRQLLARHSSNLYLDLCTFASEVYSDRHAVDAGIKAITSAFETDIMALRFGQEFRVFASLLHGKASSLWKKFVAAKGDTSNINSVGFRWFRRDVSGERIAEEVGLEGIQATHEDPGRLLDSRYISSDDLYQAALDLGREDSKYKQIRHLFEALCKKTSAGDCRETVRIVWKAGGLSWLRRALVTDICKKAELTEDEARRIQSFARGYFAAGDKI
ncbi:hypothetical protein FGB62_55g136 [Gracilaria domingensis]|nr:hypothetical protein FGB62_55g136 [Gracilaria domingensis]